VLGVFEVGAFSVLGVAAVTLLALTGLPAALVLLPRPGVRASLRVRVAARVSGALDRALARLTGFTARRAGAIIAAWALLGAVGLAAVPFVVVDTDYLSFFAPSSPVRRDF